MPSTPEALATIEVFYSYSHKDEDLRNQLEAHLSTVRRLGLIKSWHDRKILPGQEWASEIDTHLKTAHIILLLISADFLQSDYCYITEMQQALQRHEAKEATVIPIILREVDWRGSPFGKLQALPNNARPVTSWPKRDEALADVARGIREAIEEVHSKLFSVPTSSPAMLPVRPAGTPLWNIPHERNPFFTGREQVLQTLRQALTRESAAALTQIQAISGLGGIGKTQTAVEYAYHYRDDYKAVFWVRAETETELGTGFAQIAQLLGLPELEEQDLDKTVQAVKHWLENHHDWLLIFDNADRPELLKRFRPRNPVLAWRSNRMGCTFQVAATKGLWWYRYNEPGWARASQGLAHLEPSWGQGTPRAQPPPRTPPAPNPTRVAGAPPARGQVCSKELRAGSLSVIECGWGGVVLVVGVGGGVWGGRGGGGW
jgi:hypothetical protein